MDTKIISPGELFFQPNISRSNQNKITSPLYDDYARRYTKTVRHLVALSLQAPLKQTAINPPKRPRVGLGQLGRGHTACFPPLLRPRISPINLGQA